MMLNNTMTGPIGMNLASRDLTRSSYVSSMLDDLVEPWDNLAPSEYESSQPREPSSNLGDQLNAKSQL